LTTSPELLVRPAELDDESMLDGIRLPERPSPRHAPPDRRRHRAAQIAVLAAPVVVLAILAWVHRSMYYDGYIYLHVVANILAGHGPVFNQGQRVEAFTSPVWTAILSVAALLTPFHLTDVAVDLGVLLTAAGLALVIVGSTRLVRRTDPDVFVLPVGAVVFLAVPAVWSLATLGLETGLVFFWTGACLCLLIRWAATEGHRPPAWWPVVLGLGPLIRPELGVDSIVFIGTLILVDRAGITRRDRARIVAWAVVVPLAYEVFRMGYYGMLVANTAVAKEATLPRVGRGFHYFTDFTGTYWLILPALCLGFGAYRPLAAALRRTVGHRRNLAVLFALPLAGLLNAGYIVVMGGDYVHGRLLVAPLLATCAPVAVVPATRRYVISLLVVPWALLCGFTMRTNDGSPFYSSTIISADQPTGSAATLPAWAVRPPFSRPRTLTGAWVQFDVSEPPVRLDTPTAPGLVTPVVATAQIGEAPYLLGTDIQILDLLGLADPLAAHLLLDRPGQFAGHEKPLPTPWVAALLSAPGTTTAQLGRLQAGRPKLYTPLIPPVTGRSLDVETAWARADLACPAIMAVEFGPDRPLTVSSFFSNMFHSLHDTTVRIPPDPEEAYHQLCGPGTPASVRVVQAER